MALARLVSLVEQGGRGAKEVTGLAYRSGPEPSTVGITGAPGAGKSTLTAQLIAVVRHGGLEEIAVLAVDPSSPFTGGAILGDRIRMQDHALDPGVFIRSMATRGHLGGLTLAVPAVIRVLAAVGIPQVVVETVGVGQVEVEVATATDTTVVVVNPGWGDSVQANKAGLLEAADLFVINKSDRPGVRETRRDLEQMIELTVAKGWEPPIVETVASSGEGVEDLWAEIQRHRTYLNQDGLLESRRADRLRQELRRSVSLRIEEEVERLCVQEQYAAMIQGVVDGRSDPMSVADQLVAALGQP